jgi:ABC-type molybdate transport system ATPase subunit
MNTYQVTSSLAPIHAALIRLIAGLIDDQQAKILIDDATSKDDRNIFWRHPKNVLKQEVGLRF